MQRIYQVRSGESLTSIARDVLGDMDRWKELAHINGLQHPYIIRVGQVIELPTAESEDVEIVVAPKKVPAANRAAPARGFRLNAPAMAFVAIAVAAFLLVNRRPR